MVTCRCCGQELRVTCPDCQRPVKIELNKKGVRVYRTHSFGYCTGSHIEWKTCPRSEKEFKDAVP